MQIEKSLMVPDMKATLQKQESVTEQNSCLLMITALHDVFKMCIIWFSATVGLNPASTAGLTGLTGAVVFEVVPLPVGQGCTERNSSPERSSDISSGSYHFCTTLSLLTCKFNKVHIV